MADLELLRMHMSVEQGVLKYCMVYSFILCATIGTMVVTSHMTMCQVACHY